MEFRIVSSEGQWCYSLMGRSWLLVIPGILEEVKKVEGDSLDEVIKKHCLLFTEKLGTLKDSC